MKTKKPILLFVFTLLAISSILIPSQHILAQAPSLPPFQTHKQSIQIDASGINLLDQIGGIQQAVTIQGSYAYVGIGPRLVILNVADPTNPIIVGRTEVFSGYVNSITIAGNYAYATVKKFDTNNAAGLRIIDITAPANPKVIGHYDSLGEAFSVAVAGNYAYIADGKSGLQILNIANPAAPVEVTAVVPENVQMGGETKDVVIIGNYAYITEHYNHGLRVLDISNPTDPQTVAQYSERAYNNIFIAGNYAYMTSTGTPTGGLSVVDISNPSNPNEIGFYSGGVFSVEVKVAGHYAYMATTSNDQQRFIIVDVSQPSAPTQVGTFTLPGSGYPEDQTNTNIALVGEYAYFASGINGLRILDVGVPTNPTEILIYPMPASPRSLAVQGDYAFIGDLHNTYDSLGGGNLHIADISAPAQIQLASMVDTYGDVTSVTIDGNYAYVGEHPEIDWELYQYVNGQMRIIDISTPTHPVNAGIYDLDENQIIADIAIAGNYAYIVFENQTYLKIVDISNPGTPEEVGTYTPDPPANAEIIGIDTDGQYIYLVTSQYLEIVDISAPTTPTRIGLSENTSGYQTNITVNGNYAYASTNENVSIFNIAVPTAPSLISTYEPEGYDSSIMHFDVFVSGQYAFVAAGKAGVRVVDISTPETPFEVAYYVTPWQAEAIALDGGTVYLGDNGGGFYSFALAHASNISGQVLDAIGDPIADVIITAGEAYSTTTDASGTYTLTDIPAGSYTLTAFNAGYARWEPASRTITIPPEATAQDFTGYHIGKSVTSSGSRPTAFGDVLTYTIEIAYPLDTPITFYDLIPTYTTYRNNSLAAPAGIVYDSGANAINGNTVVSANTPIEVTFAVQVGITGTVGFAPPITNIACVSLEATTLNACEWSNEVSSLTYDYSVYLPLVMRSTN